MDLILFNKKSEAEIKDDVVDMLRRQQTRFSGNKEKLKAEAFLEEALKPGNPCRIFLFQKSDGITVGMALTNLGYGYETGGYYLWVNELYVNMQHRNKGYGKLLSKALMSWCGKHRVKAIYAVTSPLNKASRQMMLHVGCNLTETIWCDRQI
jgi:RimJ/RimL family protein N-acetyltransferase